MRILAVDDDKSILELLEMAIHLFGDYEVVTASSGPEAMAKIAQATVPFDCFLLDIQMPTMTGIDLCGVIRSKPDHAETPIIMLTAMAEKHYIDAAFSAGATDFITKPFDLDELKSRLHLAAKQLLASHLPQPAESTLNSMVENLTKGCPYKVGDAIALSDVDHCMRPDTFANYLQQLYRLQYFRTKIFAIQVLDIEAIYAFSTGLEFRDHMEDIAEVIADHLCEAQGLICYLGDGVFCCVIDGQYIEILEDLSIDLDAEIYQLGMVYRNGTQVDVRFDVGEPITPGIFSKLSAAAIMRQATDNLGGKTSFAKVASSLKNWVKT